ncbi:hypothetical protein EVAR_80420_1 [Eumeta japonica]|uniref:Uncharacterized protein n=1 Tax=Eumeta variegata TaxID=151549 RepID=A0A4C1VGT3_EUMVA|nr:hypothetical protein EVAR_80420_1 [Eumeta japonica]
MRGRNSRLSMKTRKARSYLAIDRDTPASRLCGSESRRPLTATTYWIMLICLTRPLRVVIPRAVAACDHESSLFSVTFVYVD